MAFGQSGVHAVPTLAPSRMLTNTDANLPSISPIRLKTDDDFKRQHPSCAEVA